MKTERRHDLRTNELAQQIDQLSDYLRRNAGRLLTGGAIVIVAAVVVFWFFSSRKAKVMDGWATLSDAALAADPATAVARFRAVAADAGTEELAIAAWLRIGETAMQQMISGAQSSTATPPTAAAEDWPAVAQEAFERVLERSGPNSATARGQAMMMLGVLAEDRRDFDKAREYYTQVAEEERFAATPFPEQARYRLDGLSRWAAPVDFPPAALVAPASDSSAGASSPVDPTAGQRVIMSQKIDLATGKVLEGSSDVPAATLIEMTTTPAKAPPATTQPADSGTGDPSDTAGEGGTGDASGESKQPGAAGAGETPKTTP